jgi:hypothetical protein
MEGYRRVAERVKIPDWNSPEVNILQLVDSWLRDETSGRWLMIVDNADNASVLAADTPEALLEFLPQSQNGAVLVTSRNREVAYSITGDNRDIITVNPMEEEHAMDLLRTKLQGEFNEDDAKTW